MAGRVEQALDEIQWRSPELVQQMQGIHANSVLFYFAQSPFFDQTSNNAFLFNQAMYRQDLLHVIATREAFEGRLKTMSGLEYMVAQEPAETAPGTGTGVWVIRKQTRRKRPGQEDESTVHATYFVMGENVYMAPAVGDVIGSRLLSILTSLNKFLTITSELPDFTPALGHTYLPPPKANRLKAAGSLLSQTSKENTPMPDSLTSNKKSTSSSSSTQNSSYLGTRLLAESLDMSFRYGDDYMDENPITGHPGDFHFSTTGRKGKDKLAIPGNAKGSLQNKKPSATANAGSKTVEVPPARKGSKSEKSLKSPSGISKPRRRKSKPNVSGASITPT